MDETTSTARAGAEVRCCCGNAKMLCALSHFLDRNAHLTNTGSESDKENSDERDNRSDNKNNTRPLTTINTDGGAKENRHNRRHLPVPKGPHTVGCVDLMCDLSDDGTFFRLYYPTTSTDIHVSTQMT